MGFDLTYCFVMGSILEKCGKFWKNVDFLDENGQIGEILHGWLRPDWGL